MKSNTCISPFATRPILYTDTLAGVQTCRDDLWAVTTEELNAAARAAPGVPAAKELALCESVHLGLRADQPYIFRVHAGCGECESLNAAYSAEAMASAHLPTGDLPAPSAPAGISQQAGGAVPVDRDSFEAWAKREGHENFMRMAGDPDQYDDLILRANFKGWMAANPALAVPVQADRGEELSPLPEPDIDGTIYHKEHKICYTGPVHYSAKLVNEIREADRLAATPVAPPVAPSLTDTQILDAAVHVRPDAYGMPRSGPDYEGYDLAVGRAVESALHSRFRAQGGMTNDSASDLALPGSTPDAAQGGA